MHGYGSSIYDHEGRFLALDLADGRRAFVQLRDVRLIEPSDPTGTLSLDAANDGTEAAARPLGSRGSWPAASPAA